MARTAPLSESPVKLQLEVWSALRDALDGAIGADELQRVVDDALAVAGLRTLPSASEDVAAFVAGPLFLALAVRLSRERAEEICLRASSQLRLRRAGDPTPAGEEPASGTQLARVVPRRKRRTK